ncbi:MAG: ABC transporter substrate-binding protein [Klebsiella pneumoniae]|nr:ABC transporter substrate-binding protein [Klebsiella pneumoniae]
MNQFQGAKPFACCDGQCAQATRAARMTSAVHACASPPSLLRLGSDH